MNRFAHHRGGVHINPDGTKHKKTRRGRRGRSKDSKDSTNGMGAAGEYDRSREGSRDSSEMYSRSARR